VSVARIPFETAIHDERLLAPAWRTFSPEQQAVMRFIYGLPVDNADLAIWHALHGGGVYDDLYYLTGVHDSGVPYIEGREYTDITLIIGRRAAKSCIGHFVLDYEALCGGHKARLAIKDQDPVFLHVSQDLGQAMSGMRQYSLYYLKSSPAGREVLGDLQKSVTQRSVKLDGCGLIKVGPPNIKVGRGDSVACAVLDEIAYWQSDEKSAAPDTEVEKAIEYSMSQFSPYAKRLKLSTPYVEDGLLWQTQQIGTRGRHLPVHEQVGLEHKLVLQGPSPVLNNPTITRVFLTEKRAKDPAAFDREIGAKFAKSVSGYLAHALVERAIDAGVRERPPQPGVFYVAAMDPAMKHDTFPLCIGHLDGSGGFVQDVLLSWQGTAQQPLNPGVVLPLIGKTLARYGIRSVMTDQHHSTSLQSLASDCTPPFAVEEFVLGVKTKNEVWADAFNLFNQGKMHLLDHPALKSELLALERVLSKSKTQRIYGRRDDHAMVTAMCAYRALQTGILAPKVVPVDEPTTPEGIKAVLALRFKASRRTTASQPAWWNR